jgi:hypothetical protein
MKSLRTILTLANIAVFAQMLTKPAFAAITNPAIGEELGGNPAAAESGKTFTT